MKLGIDFKNLNWRLVRLWWNGFSGGVLIGGGLGVRYTYSETPPSIDQYLDAIVGVAREALPKDAKLLIEPGRSLVARAGMTLYRVVSVKRSGRTFVAVDGGMADNLDAAVSLAKGCPVLASGGSVEVAETFNAM